MKKRILSLVLALSVCLSVLPVGALATMANGNENDISTYAADSDSFNGGSGTADSPYEIATAEQLTAFRDYIHEDSKHGAGKYFKLTKDINLNGSEDNQWTSIGTSNIAFAGTFDGGNHKISGLYINDKNSYQGLFGFVSGDVKNLNVNGYVVGNGNVGGIIGTLYPGNIENCSLVCGYQ